MKRFKEGYSRKQTLTLGGEGLVNLHKYLLLLRMGGSGSETRGTGNNIKNLGLVECPD